MFRKLTRFLNDYHTPLEVHVNLGPIGVTVSVVKGVVTEPAIIAKVAYDPYCHFNAEVFVGFLGVYLNITRAWALAPKPPQR